jgi:hypothetical protein
MTRKLRAEARVAVNLVHPDVSPDDDPKHERIDVERTLEARKFLADAAEKEGKPHGMPLLARSAHKIWSPTIDTSDVRVPTKDEVEAVAATRTDIPASFRICCDCLYYHHAEGQRLLWQTGLADVYRDGLGAAGVQRLGDLREYGYCEGQDNLCHPFKPACDLFVDGRKVLGKLIGGARGLWRRIGGF